MIVTDILKRMSQPDGKEGHKDYSSILRSFDRTGFVPKNIFQICLRGDDVPSNEVFASLPEEYKNAINQLRQINEGWEYQLIGDIEAHHFILEKYGEEVYSYFERINPQYGAARADFLRYLLLYCYGGAYIDIKCGVSHSLDQSIQSGKFPVFYWDNMPGGNHHAAIPEHVPGGEILQGFIVSPAGHPFLRAVIMEVMRRIDEYNPYVDGVGYGGVMKVMGPGMYTETIYDCSQKYPEDCYVAKPFAEFGFVLHYVKNMPTVSGEYQKQVRLSNYRQLTASLVSSGDKILDRINSVYLCCLSKAHNREGHPSSLK